MRNKIIFYEISRLARKIYIFLYTIIHFVILMSTSIVFLEIFILKGQCQEMFVEIRPWSERIVLN
jgi:hypothetical protein